MSNFSRKVQNWSPVKCNAVQYPAFSKEIVTKFHNNRYYISELEEKYYSKGINGKEFLLLCRFYNVELSEDESVFLADIYSDQIPCNVIVSYCSISYARDLGSTSTRIGLHSSNLKQKVDPILRERIKDELRHSHMHNYLYDKEKFLHVSVYNKLFNKLKSNDINDNIDMIYSFMSFNLGEPYRKTALPDILKIAESL